MLHIYQIKYNMKTFSKIAIYLVVFITATLITSCSNSLSDIDETQLEIASKSQAIDNQIDLRVTVLVKDIHEGKYLYKVEIFDQNPEIPNTVSLKTGYGSKDIYYATTIKLASSVKTIYIRQTDPTKKQTVKMVEFSNTSSLLCDFN